VVITTVPAAYRPGFSKIKSLRPADFDAIAAALENAPVVGGLKELAIAVGQHVSSLKRAEIEVILRSLFSLCVFLADEETPLSENLSSLASAMQASGNSQLTLSEDERIEFERRLDRLLRIKSVSLAAKGQRLKLEYQNTFHDAKILTDVRSIFDKPEDRPLGFTIAHILKITYHESGDHKDFYIALDADDIQVMKKALERAESKAGSIRSLLRAAALPDLS